MVKWQLACRRAGTGHSKGISEVSGSGAKHHPQKGTGRARAGHSRPPHWRGGAKAHGPKTRDWSYALNKNVSVMYVIQCVLLYPLVSNKLFHFSFFLLCVYSCQTHVFRSVGLVFALL